ncbi:unnamed protein product [Trypanosoma congolense IL3000]|uniref:WGS project CAEQ00000000 data, annotated contig 1881 n=1 Tax=Trypanosoma congolense (strain IL3000) TaxID=1068625 RepID=F9W9M6_TRYCI|nr:unnamed protein product [Trypanosoma congolense IL3000]
MTNRIRLRSRRRPRPRRHLENYNSLIQHPRYHSDAFPRYMYIINNISPHSSTQDRLIDYLRIQRNQAELERRNHGSRNKQQPSSHRSGRLGLTVAMARRLGICPLAKRQTLGTRVCPHPLLDSKTNKSQNKTLRQNEQKGKSENSIQPTSKYKTKNKTNNNNRLSESEITRGATMLAQKTTFLLREQG